METVFKEMGSHHSLAGGVVMSAVFRSPMDTSPLYMRFEVLPRLTTG